MACDAARLVQARASLSSFSSSRPSRTDGASTPREQNPSTGTNRRGMHALSHVPLHKGDTTRTPFLLAFSGFAKSSSLNPSLSPQRLSHRVPATENWPTARKPRAAVADLVISAATLAAFPPLPELLHVRNASAKPVYPPCHRFVIMRLLARHCFS